jgi:hypothetical protein
METDIDALLEIPCFKCSFWRSERENNLCCNPAECEELTKWLLKEVESSNQTENVMVHVKVHSEK